MPGEIAKSTKQVPDPTEFSWKGSAVVQIGVRLNKWYAWGCGSDPRQVKNK